MKAMNIFIRMNCMVVMKRMKKTKARVLLWTIMSSSGLSSPRTMRKRVRIVAGTEPKAVSSAPKYTWHITTKAMKITRYMTRK